MPEEKAMFQFKGFRDDIGQKFVPEEFFFKSYNTNQDSIAGFNRTNAPLLVKSMDIELITNGSFTTNTTGWTALLSVISSVANGHIGNCLSVANNTTAL